MKEFEEIGKKLPYGESDGYLDALIQRCSDQAIIEAPLRHRRSKVKRISYWASSIAAAAVVAGAMFVSLRHDSQYETIANSESLTQVLSEMSDEQIADLGSYAVDDIPEY